MSGSLAQIEEVLATLRDGLELDWIEIEGADGFATFRALPEGSRADLLAYAVAQTLEPKLVTELRDPVRETVEIAVLPNLRAVWTLDAAFLKRLAKSDLLEILRDMDMRTEAQTYQKAKKTGLVSYMVKLFAEPFATLTDRQRQAVNSWCPSVMMAALPTETRRSERQVQLQQFSTPLDLAFIVAMAARITKADVVLDPRLHGGRKSHPDFLGCRWHRTLLPCGSWRVIHCGVIHCLGRACLQAPSDWQGQTGPRSRERGRRVISRGHNPETAAALSHGTGLAGGCGDPGAGAHP